MVLAYFYAFKLTLPQHTMEKTLPVISSNYKTFHSLTALELYQIMRLRNEVFVVEQQCVYQDADNKDPQCYHLMLWDHSQLIGYARLLPAGLAFDEPSIGRVISSPMVRGKGVGKLLLTKAIKANNELFGNTAIKIGAQLYLKNFYEAFGFEQTSDVYLEDNIKHIEMLRPIHIV